MSPPPPLHLLIYSKLTSQNATILMNAKLRPKKGHIFHVLLEHSSF
jgi:hypothetical protein